MQPTLQETASPFCFFKIMFLLKFHYGKIGHTFLTPVRSLCSMATINLVEVFLYKPQVQSYSTEFVTCNYYEFIPLSRCLKHEFILFKYFYQQDLKLGFGKIIERRKSTVQHLSYHSLNMAPLEVPILQVNISLHAGQLSSGHNSGS